MTVYLPSAKELGRAGAGTGVGVALGVTGGVAPDVRDWPQESQKLASGRTSTEQFEQVRTRAPPHSSQNDAASRFSWLQDGHRISGQSLAQGKRYAAADFLL